MFPFFPLKAPENQKFTGVFRSYKVGPLARYGSVKKKKERKVQLSYNFMFVFIYSFIGKRSGSQVVALQNELSKLEHR